MTTAKTIDLTIQTFVGKMMSLLFNMLSRFVIAFLPRSQGLLNNKNTFFDGIRKGRRKRGKKSAVTF